MELKALPASSSAQIHFSGNPDMPTSARDFQAVLDVIKQWFMLSLHDRKVYGCLALEDQPSIRYVSSYWPERVVDLRSYWTRYISPYSPSYLDIFVRFERQLRGTLWWHWYDWRHDEEDQAPY